MQIVENFGINRDTALPLKLWKLMSDIWIDDQMSDFWINKTTQSHPSWKKDHQTKQKLNEKEAKWVSSPSSLLCLQDEEAGMKTEG